MGMEENTNSPTGKAWRAYNYANIILRKSTGKAKDIAYRGGVLESLQRGEREFL